MLTPIRIGALMATIGLAGVLALVGGPSNPTEPAVPFGAETSPDVLAPGFFTGTTVSWGSGESEYETLADRTVERFQTRFSNTVSDARLGGYGEGSNHMETIVGGDGALYMTYSAAGRLENDGGAWAFTCSGAGDTGASSLTMFHCWYDGEAGYEGLTAYSILQPADGSTTGTWDVTGWIYPGEAPPSITFEP